MLHPIPLEELKDYMLVLNEIFDSVRIVDPAKSNVLSYKKDLIAQSEESCFGFWKRGEMCENCTSYEAYKSQKSCAKLEMRESSVFMVISLPIANQKSPMVLEVLKDMTDSLVIGDRDDQGYREIIKTISHLNDVVIRDYLTSLYNRRFIDERLPFELERSHAEGSPLTILFLDLDDFGTINNCFGHEIGDDVLIKVAACIQQSIRTENDWAARYGGDEFLICLKNAPTATALHIAERIRSAIETIQLPDDSKSLRISASIGAVTLDKEKLTLEEVIHRADKMMYRAKIRGKNSCAHSPATKQST